jgi:hypothetical protein
MPRYIMLSFATNLYKKNIKRQLNNLSRDRFPVTCVTWRRDQTRDRFPMANFFETPWNPPSSWEPKEP